MKTRQKHHYTKWSETEAPKGVVKDPNTSYSRCTACKTIVRMGRVGGIKFLVNGTWTSKKPTCRVPS